MASLHTCKRCGAEITPFGPPGLCARCLLQDGFSDSPAVAAAAEDLVSVPEAGGGSRARSFGDYELLEELGHGGMGVVYKARQKSLNRLVALKMVAGGEFAGREYVQRLRAEAEAAAQLRHPHIVAIHEVGEHEGQHYFTMDYVEGSSLAELTRHHSLAPRRAAQYLRTIAEAVHFAHQHGILHRDLKPANILVDLHDQIRIMDFGLAKRLGTDSEFTVTGQLVGSPNYLSPEQAAGQHRELTPGSDVYALGAVLYHLLTGRAPFLAQTMTAILRQVQETEPLAPRLLNPGVPRDLETICLKCLEKDLRRRYATAQGLADDLGRFLEGRPILARPVGKPERLWRWCRRQPVQASLAATLLAVVLFGFAGVIWQWQQAEGAREHGERLLYAADMNLAFQALKNYDLYEAYDCLTNHWPGAGEPDLRGWEWRYLWQQCQPQALLTLGRHAGVAGALAFSPDGQWLASGDYPGLVKIWDLPSHQQLHCLTNGGDILAVAFSPDGNRLAVGSGSGIRLWDTRTWREEDTVVIQEGARAESLCFTPDGRRLVAANSDGCGVWQVGETLANLAPFPGGTNVFSPGQHACALVSNGGKVVHATRPTVVGSTSVILQDLETGDRRTVWASKNYNVRALAVSPDDQWLAIALNVGPVEIHALQNLVELGPQATPSHTLDTTTVFALAFSPDGKLLAAGGKNGRLELWETTSWRKLQTGLGHFSEITDIAFSPDTNAPLLATSSSDGTVRLWSTASWNREDVLAWPGDTLTQFVDPNWRTALYVNRQRGTWALQDLATGATVAEHPLPYAATNIAWAAVGPGGALVAFALEDRSVRLWDVVANAGKGEERWKIPTQATMDMLHFSPDGRLLFGLGGGRMWVRDVAAGREIGHATNCWSYFVYRPQFTASRRQLAIPYGSEGEVCLWNLAGSGQIIRFAGRHPDCLDLALCPDGRTMATVNRSGTLKLWDVAARKEIGEIVGRGLGFFAVAFTPDSQRVITGSTDELKVWDVRTRREVADLTGGTDNPEAFSLLFQDPDTLLVAGAKGIRRLHAPSFAEIEEAERARKIEEGRWTIGNETE